MKLSSTPAAAGLDLAVPLHGDQEAGLRGTVELLQVDADGTEEHQQMRPDCLAGRVNRAHPAEPEHIAQGAVDQQVADGIGEPAAEKHPLARKEARPDALSEVHAEPVQAALEIALLLHADRDALGHRLQQARRC